MVYTVVVGSTARGLTQPLSQIKPLTMVAHTDSKTGREREAQEQTVTDKIWAVTTDGNHITYRLADYTPHGGYSYLADVMARVDADEDALLDSLRGTCDHRVVGHAALSADKQEIIAIDIADDLPRY